MLNKVLAFALVAALLGICTITGCKKKVSEPIKEPIAPETSTVEKSTTQPAQPAAEKAATQTEEAAKAAAQKAQETAQQAAQKAQESAQQAAKDANAAIQKQAIPQMPK